MARLTPTEPADYDDEQRRVYDRLVETRGLVDGRPIGGPFDVWLLSGELARRAVGMGNMFRFRLSVDRRHIELAILVTGQFWRAQFEWYAHEPMARDAGVPEDVIAAIRDGRRPDFESPADHAVYQLCSTLHREHRVDDATFATAVEHFGQRGVAELVNLIGFYTMVSLTLNTFEVPLPDGAEPPFTDGG